jgi:phosphoglycerate dehydrogenase-like enzyme
MALKVVVPNQLMRNEVIVERLEAEGCEIIRLPPWESGASSEWSGEEIERYWMDADAFVGTFGPKPVSRKVLEAAKKLRVGASPIIGTETIDVDAATELGIAIGYGAAPENLLGVAEAVVMLIAALLKHLPGKWEAVRSGGWRVTDPGHMVMNRTIGLVGLGNIGRAVAARFQGWEVRLLAADPYVKEDDARLLGVELVDLDTLCRESDVVSVMTVLNAETYHLVGEHQIGLMRRDAFVINTSRGPCVDEEALIKALDEGRIAGAAVDAWEQEPTRENNPLRAHPKVIATGHNVGHSEEVYAALPGLAAENILKGLRGEPPTCFRNPDVFDRWKARMAGLGVTVRA